MKRRRSNRPSRRLAGSLKRTGEIAVGHAISGRVMQMSSLAATAINKARRKAALSGLASGPNPGSKQQGQAKPANTGSGGGAASKPAKPASTVSGAPKPTPKTKKKKTKVVSGGVKTIFGTKSVATRTKSSTPNKTRGSS